MRLLAFDATTDIISAALCEDGAVIAEQSLPADRYTGTLLPALAALLAASGWQLDRLGALAVGTGPGSFTGVRVGLATAKGLAHGLRIPLIGVPSLEVLANQMPWDGEVVAALDARRSEVYWGSYQGRVPRVGAAPRLTTTADFVGFLAERSGDVLVVGTAADLELDWPDRAVVAGPAFRRPLARALSSLAYDRRTGEWRSLFEVSPIYWRPADAVPLAQRKARAR